MAINVGSIFIDIRAGTATLVQDGQEGVSIMRKIGGDMSAGFNSAFSVGDVFKQILPAVSVAGAIAGLVSINDQIKQVGVSAEKLGASTEGLQAIQQLGSRFQLDAAQVNQAMKLMEKDTFNIGEAAANAGQEFTKLGLDAKTLVDLPIQQQMQQVTKALMGVSNANERAGIATKIFGSAGQELLPLFPKLASGATAMDFLQQKTGLFGIAIGKLDDKNVKLVQRAFDELQKSVYDVSEKTDTAAFAFKDLGLDMKAMEGMTTDQRFEVLADAFSKVKDATERAGLAVKIFGRSGLDMLPILTGGSKAIEDMKQKLKDLGAGVSQLDTAKIEAETNAFANLKLIVTGAATQFALALSPAIIGVANDITQTVGVTGGFKSAMLDVVEYGVKGVAYLADAWDGWIMIVKFGRVVFADILSDVFAFSQGVLEALLFLPNMLGSVWNAVLGLATTGINAFIGSINIVIEKYNEFTGMSVSLIDTLKTPLSINDTFLGLALNLANQGVTALGKLKDAADVTAVAMAKDLSDYLDKPLPTDNVDEWLTKARLKAAQLSQTIVSAQPPLGATGAGVPPGGFIPPSAVAGTDRAATDIQGIIKDKVYNPIQAALDEFQNSIKGLITGTLTWSGALRNVATEFLTTVIQGFVQMAAVWAAQQIGMAAASTAAQSATAAASIASAGGIAAAWAPAALAASIATLGMAAGIGEAAFISAMASGVASGVAIGAAASFASGLVNSAGGAAGTQVAGHRATGGPVQSGLLYGINEAEPEFFKPDSSGQVIPLSKMGDVGSAGDRESGPNITIHQSFSSGVTRQELAQQAETIRKQTTLSIADHVSRGGAFRKRLQS